MSVSWPVIIPPLLVLLVAVVWRNVLWALSAGILCAAALVTSGNLLQAAQLVLERLISEGTSPEHLYTFGFLIMLGILIQIMTHSGGIQAYTRVIQNFLTSKRSAESISLLVSLSLFLDDYLNSLTTGAIMRPITDTYRIPRIKLAFLLNSMSGPLCLIIPASSWVAFILGQMQASGISLNAADNPVISADPVTTYLATIPYLFYPLLIVASGWFIVRKGISYGKIYEQEQTAETTGNLFGGKTPLTPVQVAEESSDKPAASLAAFIVPMVTFLAGIPTIALAIAGWSPFGGELIWYKALQNADLILQALFFASVVALGITTVYYLSTQLISRTTALKSYKDGFISMQSPLLVLLCAWTFGSILKNDLKTGIYVANLLIGAIPAAIMPLIFFFTSTLITVSTGSSWGTATIMLPIGVPLLASLNVPALLWPVLGGIFSGMVAGSHISPITDATIVAASSSESYHLDHVQSQTQYSIPALVGASVGFLLSGLLPATTWGCMVNLLAAALVTGGLLLWWNKR